ncbi:hypothetical protein SHJG_7868 [Streptomyces hygroscopicus subsp. jinggangensis 5008]|nr:hypothetical protein SHJG_7868 [Streptomyces hygroscopicus subsp. jinggangensis 5008]AGF67292.1 hypothetical protein SHJGH_7630 [Streptomyces hygroscopicus subsp. jinggangensis TL01]
MRRTARASGLVIRSRWRWRTLASGSVRPLRLSGRGCRHLPVSCQEVTRTVGSHRHRPLSRGRARPDPRPRRRHLRRGRHRRPQPVEGAVPDTDLVRRARGRCGGPGPVPSGGAGHRRGRRARRGGGPPSAVRVPLSPEFAQRGDGDEAFGDGGGEADAGEGGGVAVAEQARVPLGEALGVGAVQGFQLPPAGEEQQQPAPQPQDRSGTDAGALLEGRAEDGEVQGDAAHARFRRGGAQFGDHELHDPVRCRPVTAHQVQGDAVAAPGHEGEQREQPAVLAEGLHEQAVAVGGVAEPVQGHGEAAFGLGVPPGVGLADDLLHLAFAEVRVAADAADGSGAADPVHGLPGDAHPAAGQIEFRDVQDRLVAELEGAEAGAGTGAGPGLGGAHDGGRPGVPAGQIQPGVDGARPGLRVADGIPGGQAHPGLDAVGDGRLAAGREDDGLVAPGGEVAEGVPVAVRREQGADAGLLVAVQGGFQALGAEQRGRRVQQGEGAEQAEQEGHLARWAAVEDAARDQPAAHPVGGPGQVPAGRERAGEEQHQAPAEECRHGEPGQQHGEGPPYGSAAGDGVELPAGEHEQEQQQGAQQAEGGEEGREALRDPAEVSAGGRVCRRRGVPPCGGLRGGGHGSDSRKGRRAAPAERPPVNRRSPGTVDSDSLVP